MKILYINTLYTPNLIGGAERVVQSLAESIVKLGHQAVVVSVTSQKGTRIDQVNGVKVYYIGLKNLYWPYRGSNSPNVLKTLWHALDTYNFLMARELGRILDSERPDLVHTHTLEGFSVLVWKSIKQRSLPLIHTLHDYYLLCPKSTMFRNGRNCQRRCTQCLPYTLYRNLSSDQVDVVVGVSEFVLERHLGFDYFAATPKKEVIYNAYKAQSPAPASGIRRLPIRFGYLGRLDPTKGLEVLLESVTRLPEGTWTLTVGGKGLTAYENYLRGKYKVPAVKFSGYVRPEAFFSDIDVLIVPSIWHEPFGRVIIEAYASGVPVVGSNRGGIPELIEEGRTGFLFEPSRPSDLPGKMQRFIDDPATIADMRSACLKKVKSLSPEGIAEQYLQVYVDATTNL